MVDVEGLKHKKQEYPDATVVSYVNTTAAVKAESDICCTSSNAIQVVESIKSDQILFVPDQNLGGYVAQNSDKEIILWDGYCNTHHAVEVEDVKMARSKHPEVPVLVHPECGVDVAELADYVGSTAGILTYARESKAKELIIGTEKGIIHRLCRENPGKQFYLLTPRLVCPNMKKISLEKVKNALLNMEYKIELSETIRVKANKALNKMLEVTS
jgi:quinolinate synthase